MTSVCIYNSLGETWDMNEGRFRNDVLLNVPNSVHLIDQEYWRAMKLDATTNIAWYEDTESSIEHAIAFSLLMHI